MNVTGLRTNKELRAMAREQLKGNWMAAILTNLVFIVVVYISMIIPIWNLLSIGVFGMGLAKFYLNLSRNENPMVENIFGEFCGRESRI